MEKKHLKKHKGFTLIESLVAIAILSVSISVAFGVMSKALTSSADAKNQIIAVYLAQEAIEYFRNMKDSNFLGASGTWPPPLDCFNDYCDINDPQSDFVDICSGTSCGNLQINSSGLYGHLSGTNTAFKREIRFKQLSSSPDIVGVEVKMTLPSGNSFIVKENYYQF